MVVNNHFPLKNKLFHDQRVEFTEKSMLNVYISANVQVDVNKPKMNLKFYDNKNPENEKVIYLF